MVEEGGDQTGDYPRTIVTTVSVHCEGLAGTGLPVSK